MDIKEKINSLKENGYVVLDSILSENECSTYKEMLESDYLKYSPFYKSSVEKSSHSLEDKSHEKVVFNLHNKRLEYYDLFTKKEVIEILDIALKEGSYMNSEPYYLCNISARNPSPYSKGQQLHLDSNLPGGDFPIIIVVLFMLDDFTEENGATRIVLGSHKNLSYAEDGKKYENEKIVTGKKGSILLYNASLWHGGGDKKDDKDRWALILGYARWFIKPSFDFMKNMPKSIFDNLNDEQKEILGYKLNPPQDEFTRMRRRSDVFEEPSDYFLPGEING